MNASQVDTDDKTKPTRRAPEWLGEWVWKPIRWIVRHLAPWAAVAVTLGVGFQALSGARDSDVRISRTEAYTSYIEAHQHAHEFLWKNVYWAGKDKPVSGDNGVPDEIEEAFWAEASQLQADMISTNLRARMLTQGGEVDRVFKELSLDYAEVYLKFKCMSAASETECKPVGKDISPATNAEIVDLLRGWSDRSWGHKEELVRLAGDQLTR